MTEFIALNPLVFSINQQTLNEFSDVKTNCKNTLKVVSKVEANQEIKHDDTVHVSETSEAFKKHATSIQSFKHQLYTCKQQKIAIFPFYDNTQMID